MKRDQWEKVRGIFVKRTSDAELTKRLDAIEARIAKNDKAIEELRLKDAKHRLGDGLSLGAMVTHTSGRPYPALQNIPTKKKK